jgi:hypothetical protein
LHKVMEGTAGEVDVDVRTAPGFVARATEGLIRAAVAGLDAPLPAPRATGVAAAASWAPYRPASPCRTKGGRAWTY